MLLSYPMKSTFLKLSLMLALAAAVSLCADEEPVPDPAYPATIMIVDLRKELPGLFDYSSWKDLLTLTPSGIAVLGSKGAQGNGGMGRAISPAMDFSRMTYVEVALGTIPGNEVPQITVALNDADGTQFTARINVDQLVPGQPVWMRVRREDFRLNPGERGADGEMDWTKVATWHLQGDWNTKKPCKVIFVAMRERS